MKSRFTIFLCLGILTIFLLTACGSKKTATISITSKDWSCWNENSDSEAEEKSYTVKVGDSIELGGLLNLTIKIKTISDDGVTFETNTPMSENENGNVNLNTDKTKFKISANDGLKLITPTMDAGNCYEFSLQK